MGRNPKWMPPEVGDTSWMKQGSCRNYSPEPWFSDDPVEILGARQICRQCPVIDECREFSLANKVDGIWADTDLNQRRALRGKRTRERRKLLKLEVAS